jgi:hypothetical protein
VVMKNLVFCDITPCSPFKSQLTFRNNMPPLSSGSISQSRNQQESGSFSEVLLAIYFHSGFLLGLFFDREDGGHMFLRKFG